MPKPQRDRVTETISMLSYLDDMIEVVLGLVRLESLLGLKVALVVRLLQLLEEDLEVPELVDDGLVEQEPDILLVEEGLDLGEVALLSSLPIPRLSRVDSFQDAQSPEILLRGRVILLSRYRKPCRLHSKYKSYHSKDEVS